MILTCHGDETRTVSKRGKQKTKLVCGLNFNLYMIGVDLKDQLLQSYFSFKGIRVHKRYKKLLCAKFACSLPGKHGTKLNDCLIGIDQWKASS